jgi:hypothetical protein
MFERLAHLFRVRVQILASITAVLKDDFRCILQSLSQNGILNPFRTKQLPFNLLVNSHLSFDTTQFDLMIPSLNKPRINMPTINA